MTAKAIHIDKEPRWRLARREDAPLCPRLLGVWVGLEPEGADDEVLVDAGGGL